MSALARQAEMFGSRVSGLTGKAKRALAFHEAGHAVILEVTGGRVEVVHCELSHPAPVHAVKGSGWSVSSVLAGIASERVAGLAVDIHPAQLSQSERRLLGWEPDLAHFARLNKRKGRLRAALAATERLVHEHWPTIAAVADALVAHEVLNGEKVRELVA